MCGKTLFCPMTAESSSRLDQLMASENEIENVPEAEKKQRKRETAHK